VLGVPDEFLKRFSGHNARMLSHDTARLVIDVLSQPH
jgi:hypothetical protein